MYVTEVTTKAEFLALKNCWDRVLLQNPASTPFQSWEWNHSWWECLRGEKEPLFLIVRDEKDSEVQSIAPFWIRTYPGGMKVLELIGARGTDYLDFAVLTMPTANNARVLKAIFAHLDRHEFWEVINLEDIAEDSPLIQAVHGFCQEKGYELNEWITCPCHSIILPSSWSVYVEALSTRMKRALFYDRRRLARHFAVHFLPNESSELIPTHMVLHQARQRSLNRPGSFRRACTREFVSRVARRFEERRWLRLSFLKVNDELAASVCACVFQGRVFAMTVGFDPKYARYSIGTVLYGYCIERAITERLSAYDLSRGAEPYKRRWNAREENNLGLAVFRSEASAHSYPQNRADFVRNLGYSPVND